MKEETRHRQSFDNNYNGTAVKDKRTGLVQLASKRLMSLFLVKNKGLRCPLCCWLGELAQASQWFDATWPARQLDVSYLATFNKITFPSKLGSQYVRIIILTTEAWSGAVKLRRSLFAVILAHLLANAVTMTRALLPTR